MQAKNNVKVQGRCWFGFSLNFSYQNFHTSKNKVSMLLTMLVKWLWNRVFMKYNIQYNRKWWEEGKQSDASTTHFTTTAFVLPLSYDNKRNFAFETSKQFLHLNYSCREIIGMFGKMTKMENGTMKAKVCDMFIISNNGDGDIGI